MNPMALYFDNSGVVAQAKEPRSHMKTRHIECKYHIIRQYVEKAFVKVLKVHTDLNVSDPMPRALSRAKHEQLRIALGVKVTMETRLLTLVQVGDCWKYALEAIILYYYISFIHN
jgi:hypothetical protein